MPSGYTHAKITKTIAILALPAYFYFNPVIATGLEVGILLTLVVNPDNDLTTSRLGQFKWLGFEWYKRLVSHRYGLNWNHWRKLTWKTLWKVIFFSHTPFTGTLLRLIITLYVPLIVLLLLSALQLWLFWFIIGVYLGMGLSDTGHMLADVMWSGIKKLFPFLRERENKKYAPYKRRTSIGGMR
jgi:uncharacterized metal-binding protein